MLQNGYEPNTEDLKTEFVKDLYEINQDAIYIESSWGKVSQFAEYGGFGLLSTSGDLNYDIAIRQPQDVKDAETYYDGLYKSFLSRWDDIVRDYYLAIGKE